MASSPTETRYAVAETRDLVETHRLVDRQSDAEVLIAPLRGGMVTQFRIGDDQLLYLDRATLRDHAQNVRGGIPILFPVAGRLAGDTFPVDGAHLPMSQHGFARRMPWRVSGIDTAGAASLSVTLDANDATLAQWPFRFQVTFEYRLSDGALAIRQRFSNHGHRPMPIHPGLHPYFFVERGQKSGAHVLTNGTTARDTRSGAVRPLTLPIDLAGGEVDLQILDHSGATVGLERPGRPPLSLGLDPTEAIVTVWTLPGRDFVCVEPWSRASDAVNRGEALWVAPQQTHEAVFEIRRA
jgi:galactose mutarotase-like enzyme